MTKPRGKILYIDDLEVQIAKKLVNSNFENRHFEESFWEDKETELGIITKHQRVK